MNVILAGTSASFSNRTDFSCQCIKLVGKRPRVAALHHELSFANHVHQLTPAMVSEKVACGLGYQAAQRR